MLTTPGVMGRVRLTLRWLRNLLGWLLLMLFFMSLAWGLTSLLGSRGQGL
jgi:hypothetical protein